MRSFSPAAYTLVELLVALALSLLLLLAVTELLSRVGGTMNDTRSAMSVSANLHEAALLLRQDFARIPDSLASKPQKIAAGEDVSDRDGYLEIVEGPDTIGSHPFVNKNDLDEDGNPRSDTTVGDVDDIIAFTAFAYRFRGLDHANFRGLVLGDTGEFRIEETEAAEIAWFVRGNTLYRRVRLIPDDASVSERARRENRLLHVFRGAPDSASRTTQFPFPLYDLRPAYSGWRYLRVPTLEETIHENWTEPQWKTIPINLDELEENPDLWEQPHFFPNLQDRRSGSLTGFVARPNRHPRAGEDVVLTNVLSFDVKMWCPKVSEFVDLGWTCEEQCPCGNQCPSLPIDDVDVCPTKCADRCSPWCITRNNQPLLLRTWDSWTCEYSGESHPDPPYTAPLQAIQITLRCFDPASRVIKQVTVVHRFK